MVLDLYNIQRISGLSSQQILLYRNIFKICERIAKSDDEAIYKITELKETSLSETELKDFYAFLKMSLENRLGAVALFSRLSQRIQLNHEKYDLEMKEYFEHYELGSTNFRDIGYQFVDYAEDELEIFQKLYRLSCVLGLGCEWNISLDSSANAKFTSVREFLLFVEERLFLTLIDLVSIYLITRYAKIIDGNKDEVFLLIHLKSLINEITSNLEYYVVCDDESYDNFWCFKENTEEMLENEKDL